MTPTPVLLCGGHGTRLWPVSRRSYPTQFAPLIGEESLFQATAQRMAGMAAPLVITASDFRFIVTEQLQAVGIDPGAVLIEPEARNTAPAVLAAALHLIAQDPQAVMLICPSDHLMPDADALAAAVATAQPALEAGRLVTFGITPDRPETGYGYLELAEPAGAGAVPLKRFVEKPDADTAARMIADGTHLWNAGIFLARASDMIAAFEAHAGDLMAPVREAVERAQPDLGFLRLAPDPGGQARAVSIDYAVMEQLPNLSVVPYSAAWSDLGSWDAVWRASAADEHGVVTQGSAMAIDCENALLRADGEGMTLVGLGLQDIIAVATPDAVLVADTSRTQHVGQAVAALKVQAVPQADAFPKDHRPWGWFERLALGTRFQVKRIMVKPGAAISKQSHHHRSEHWIVVEGTARVTIDETEHLVSENQSVYIPLGAVHRLENPGKVPMVLIE
ncbi:MAG: mannose-1-phosphate guanylyltransferase/mannose-6-phosphate isomerase, partial [Pseudomonadota bacterium]